MPCYRRTLLVARLKGHQCEQQPQALRKANQDKTDSYCLDRQYVLPQAEFTDHQNVKTPEPKSDHRDAADTDHIGKDLSHGQLLRLPTDSQGEIGGALGIRVNTKTAR